MVIITAVLAVLAVGSRIQAFGVQRDWYPEWVGRKVAHVGFGVLVLLSWALYPEGPAVRWIATVPPTAVALYFTAIGLGWVSDPGTVRAGSRAGSPAGLLRGPVFYSGVFVLLTITFWRTSPVGMAALGFMILGDGMAEVFGKTIRSPSLPWNSEKSVAGSVAAFVFGWIGGIAGLSLLISSGWIAGPLSAYAFPMVWVAVAGTAVESLPFREIDNATATLGCVAVGMLVFA